MNKDNAKDYLPLVQALTEGKMIQYYDKCENSWLDLPNTLFIGNPSEYRVKPEPREWLAIVRELDSMDEFMDEVLHKNEGRYGCKWVKVREVLDDE